MKTGITSGSFHYIEDLGARYAHIRALGYDTVDESLMDTEEAIYHDEALFEKHCAAVRAATKNSGLEISQVHGAWPTDDSTPEKRAEGQKYLRQSLYGCYLLGSKHLVIHPPMPYGWSSEDDPDFVEEIAVQRMKDLMPDCEKYGVTLCLENMPMKAHRISVMPKIVEAVKKVDSKNVGVCLDTGHCNVFGHDLGEAVRIAAPYLRVLHIHDNDGSNDLHRLPYLGTANWASFTTALAEIGFSGSLSLETGGPVSGRMPETVRTQAEKLTAATVRYLADQVDAAR